MDLPVVDPAQHGQIGQLRLAAALPRHDVVALAPRRRPVAPGVRAAAIPGGHRAAQPVRDGACCPAHIEGLTGTIHDDRHHRGVAAQHPQRLGRRRAAEVQSAAARARFSRSSSRTSTFTCGRRPPRLRDIPPPPWSSMYPHTSASASACRSPAERSSSPVSGFAFASITAAMASNIAASSNRPLIFPLPVAAPGQVQFVDLRRRPVVGLGAVLVQRRDQRDALLVQLAGVYSSAFAASCSSAPAHCSGVSRPAGLLAEHAGDRPRRAASSPVRPRRPPRWRAVARQRARRPARPVPSRARRR